MNTKIFALVTEKINEAFHLDRFESVRNGIDKHIVLNSLPWTPARQRKFVQAIEQEAWFEIDLDKTIEDSVAELDRKYSHRFFQEMWRPRTDDYSYTGWSLVKEINDLNPMAVLDVGCGYHPFKERVQNIVGIDPYNDNADYMVDVLEYTVLKETYDVIIALGSINFNSRDEIEARFSHCVDLLKTGGTFYLRANPGISHKNGPYVDIFPWSFEVAQELALKYNLDLLTFKRDSNNRLFFSYRKLRSL